MFWGIIAAMVMLDLKIITCPTTQRFQTFIYLHLFSDCFTKISLQCQTEGVVYQATVTRHDNNKEETYIGLTENTFKIRYTQHKHSFRHDQKRNQTALSKYLWTLKDKNIDYTIKWRTVARGRAYTTSTKSCRLYIKEKYFIVFKPQMATLNIRNELGSECRHKKKHLLCNA